MLQAIFNRERRAADDLGLFVRDAGTKLGIVVHFHLDGVGDFADQLVGALFLAPKKGIKKL